MGVIGSTCGLFEAAFVRRIDGLLSGSNLRLPVTSLSKFEPCPAGYPALAGLELGSPFSGIRTRGVGIRVAESFDGIPEN